ncbi:MAG: glycosyltransferase family 4 protein [Blastocatellia bacterium]
MSTFFITTSYGDLSISKYFRALAEELARRGHCVVVIVAGQRHDVVNRESNPAFLTWPSPRPTGWRDAAFLYSLIREHRPDCIIGNFGAVNLCVLVGKLCGVPHRIAWYHSITRALDTDNTAHGWKRALRKLRKRWVYKFATGIIANSVAAARDAQAVYGVPAAKCRALPYLIPDPALQNHGELSNKVICVGRLNESKGQETLIRAAKRIREALPNVLIEFVGDGPERRRYESLAASLGVGDCCQFIGALPLSDVLPRVSFAAVSVTASRNEALGLANVEAHAVGTPVVASAVDGITEVVLDGVTGFLARPGDPEDFAEKIIRLLTNAGMRKEFGHRAREHFLATFCNKNIARHADLIEQIAKDGGSN